MHDKGTGMKHITVGPFALLPSQLSIVKHAPIEEWEEAAQVVFGMQKWAPFWIGDMVLFGEARFGDEFWQVPPMDASRNSIDRFVGVTGKIKPEDRAKTLSFTHHMTAMRIKEPSVRAALLRRAESQMMDTEEFSQLVRSMT